MQAQQSQNSEPAPSMLSRRSALAVGAATLLASGIFRQGLGFVTLAVTARLLTPEDFGVIAYFLIAAALLEMFQRQIGLILIRLEDVTSEHLDTVFSFQILFGLISAALFWIMQPLVALLGIPALTELMPVLSALALVLAIRSPRFLLFERGLRFSYIAGEETTSRVVYTISAITLSWLWQDYWAVVVASFAGQVTRGVWTYYFAPMAPRFSLSRWRESLSFSSWSMGAQLAQFFSTNAPQLIIGATLGLADAGLFRVGTRLVNVVTHQLFTPMLRVMYPGLADLSRKTDQGREGFRKINAGFLAILLPVSIGFALVSQDAIIVGLGYQWVAAAQVVWILAPLYALDGLQANVRSAVYIEGSTPLLFIRNTALLVIVVGLMWVGVQYGLTGALIATGLANVAALFATLIIAKRFGNGGFFEPLTVGWRSFVACAIMTVAVLATDFAIRTAIYEPRLLVIITVKVLVGVFVYTASHIALWAMSGRPDGFETLVFSLVARLRNRSDPQET
ncbi:MULTISPECIES: oligosaccharide flippase family protein [unclassified Ruegeria]|uniref:oligosaccharide flippase family protein n=1 Tax=unclassified Ruegeria TaxID=2625375 RepID=UPI001489F60A|nr:MULTISPECIES: oligosaccharide flippase family protein [unclassified Ruegeria]NOD65586.1 oligosaccharide flippase family protein [Ruegeria sp. HKCCD6109]